MPNIETLPSVRVLGLNFFNGTAREAVRRAVEIGGVIVAPSGTCFQRLQRDLLYQQAMLDADLVLPDSGLMVSLWRILKRRQLQRVSGLAYLRELIGTREFRQSPDAVWILPHQQAREKLLGWAAREGIPIDPADCYLAPIYGAAPADDALLQMIENRRPRHVIVGLAGGVQEKLGAWLKHQLSFRPAIHCIGGALGFVTGDQVAIPAWADRLYLGWLLRLLADPRRFAPRARLAFSLPALIATYGEHLPPHRADGE